MAHDIHIIIIQKKKKCINSFNIEISYKWFSKKLKDILKIFLLL